MNSVAKEIRILVAVIGLGLAGLVLLVKFTDVCQLQAVTLNGEPLSQWDRELGLNRSKNLFRQPLDSVASAMLAQSGIIHVDIKYQLPNGLSISTNDLEPICYVLDEFSGIMYGADQTGRAVALDPATIDWERPIITGVRIRGLHQFCSDSRVAVLVPQILRLEQEYPELFHLIEEVNLSNPEYVRVAISGLRYTLKLPSDKFAERFADFRKFMSRFKPATAGVSSFDLTYDDMIIRVGNVGQKKKAPIDTALVNDVAELRDDSAPVPEVISTVTKPVTKAAPVVKKATITKKPAAVSGKTSKKGTSGKLKAAPKKQSSKPQVTKPSTKKPTGGKTKPAAKKSTRKTS